MLQASSLERNRRLGYIDGTQEGWKE